MIVALGYVNQSIEKSVSDSLGLVNGGDLDKHGRSFDMSSTPLFYISTSSAPSSEDIHVPVMGLHEVMPPGMIHHGGKGSEYPCVIMLGHSPFEILAGKKWHPALHKLVIWEEEAEHHYGNADESWDHSWIQISGARMNRLLRNSSLPLGTPLDLGGDALPMRYLTMICEELRQRPAQDPDMLEALVRIFLHDVSRHWNVTVSPHRGNKNLEAARNFIEAHFAQPFDLREVSAQAHLSPSHFCHAFSQQFGIPPHQYALNLRLQRSIQLLANRELAIFQVAEMVGCPDPLYFSKLFRRRYGFSPRQYREKHYACYP